MENREGWENREEFLRIDHSIVDLKININFMILRIQSIYIKNLMQKSKIYWKKTLFRFKSEPHIYR